MLFELKAPLLVSRTGHCCLPAREPEVPLDRARLACLTEEGYCVPICKKQCLGKHFMGLVKTQVI